MGLGPWAHGPMGLWAWAHGLMGPWATIWAKPGRFTSPALVQFHFRVNLGAATIWVNPLVPGHDLLDDWVGGTLGRAGWGCGSGAVCPPSERNMHTALAS